VRRGIRVVAGSFGGVAATALLAGAGVCLTSGCSTVGYYARSVTGHLELLQAARPVPQVLDDPATSAKLKERLALSQRIRDFAVSALGEPDNASYRRYADLHRPAAVWNVVAAPELSLVPKTWCFWIVGCVGYRGYYAKDDAETEAAQLRSRGLEVSVYGVPAYSTLGWMNWAGGDPLLSTFIRYPEGELARLIFHELAHQVAYASGDTEFNESFATAVEHLGIAHWLADRASPEARADYERFDARRRDFQALTRRFRKRLETLYASGESDAVKRERKAQIMSELHAEYAALKAERWNGYGGYDAWFERANNAALGVLAAYTGLVPQFERLFEHDGRDFERFYADVKRLARLPKDERRATLAAP
jgi:predicted aminopeptidase